MKFIVSYIRQVIISIVLLLASCESSDNFLTEINPNTVTPESFWQNESDAEKWVISCYSALIYAKGPSWQASFPRFFAWATVNRSDEYRTDFPFDWAMANAEFTLDATNPLVGFLWDPFWMAIYRSNVAIQKIPEVPGISDEKRKELMGEAQFIRGVSYFYLINLWYKVPLITTPPIDDSEFYPPTVERDLVWQQIIEDLTDAKANLSAVRTRDASQHGRATWGAAVGHLGKAYLYLEDWSTAASEFKELIDSDIYDLVADYNDNCNDLNENNIESIFEAQSDDRISPDFSSWRGRDGGPKDFASNDGFVEPWLVRTFLEERTIGGEIDPRAFATLIFPHPESTLYGGLTYEEAYGTLDPGAPAYWRKYRNVDTRPNDTDGFQSGINDRIMRFADVLLMYAEAENEANGPTPAAQAAFNRVRDRVNMSNVDPAISKDNFREVIRRERVLELSAEDNRWMDLKRWGILEERFNDPEVLSGKLFDINRHEYYPIPQSDILTNPNLEQYANY